MLRINATHKANFWDRIIGAHAMIESIKKGKIKDIIWGSVCYFFSHHFFGLAIPPYVCGVNIPSMGSVVFPSVT